MAEDLVTTLFAEARARHESACRWFCLSALALAVFHSMIFHPYVDLTRKKAEVEATLSDASALKQELNLIEPRLIRLKEQSTDEAARRLKDFVDDLKTTFGRVNTVLSRLRELGPDAAAGKPGEELFAQPGFSMVVQMPAFIANAQAQTSTGPSPVEMSPGVGLPAMNAALRRGLAGMSTRDALLNLIKPYVDGQIIEPRLSNFNSSWQQEALPAVRVTGDALVTEIRSAAARFPKEAASWTAGEQTVSAVVQTATQFKVQEPVDRFWWAAAESKDAMAQGSLVQLSQAALGRSAALDELLRRAEAAIDSSQRRQAEIAGLMEKLNEEFREQQKQLASLVEPLKTVSIDLANVVPHFPFILGACFIFLTGWLTARLGQLGQAVTLVARGDPSSLAPQWLLGFLRSSPWHRGVALFGRSVALVAWVALAGSELIGAPVGRSAEIIPAELIGAIGIALASLYEWRTARSLRGVFPPSASG
jgi:hypothetical protein